MSKKNKQLNEIDFGGAFNTVDDTLWPVRVYLTKVTYSGPATIAFWSDGTKTVTKCSPHDVYNKETGLAICMLKKMLGARTVMNTFKNWVPSDITEESFSITTRDIRNKLKASL